MSDIHSLEYRLLVANARVQRAESAIMNIVTRTKTEKWEEFWSAKEAVLRLERQLATAKGEEYAEPCDVPLKWDRNTPMPHCMMSEQRALIAFLLAAPGKAAAARQMKAQSPADEMPEAWALVDFGWCVFAKLSSPYECESVIDTHPLMGKGLEESTGQRVVNSCWIKDVERISAMSLDYRPECWRDLTHFIFSFTCATFECIARSYKA